MKKKLITMNTKLTIIWVETSPEVCKQRMIDRNSDRDTWKLQNWDEYIKTVNFNIPAALDDPDVLDDLLIFKNSSDAEYKESMRRIVDIIENS